MVNNNNKRWFMNNKILKKSVSVLSLGAIAVVATAYPDVAMAGVKDVSQLAAQVEGNIEGVKKLAVSIAFMFGLILFIGGLYLIYKDSKQPGQDHAKKGFISIIVGTCLLLLPLMIDIAGGSLGDEKGAGDSMRSSGGF